MSFTKYSNRTSKTWTVEEGRNYRTVLRDYESWKREGGAIEIWWRPSIIEVPLAFIKASIDSSSRWLAWWFVLMAGPKQVHVLSSSSLTSSLTPLWRLEGTNSSAMLLKLISSKRVDLREIWPFKGTLKCLKMRVRHPIWKDVLDTLGCCGRNV